VGTAGETETLVQKTINSLNLLDFDTMKSKVETFFKKVQLKPKKSILQFGTSSNTDDFDDAYDTINRTMIVNNDDGTMRFAVEARGDEGLRDVSSGESTLTLTANSQDSTSEIKFAKNAVKSEIRHFELDTAHLMELSKEEANHRLRQLDEQMEAEIEMIKRGYAKKRAIIEEVIKLKND
jgi:hypothetical protein